MPTLVTVETSARLHLGFLDLNGESGRKFGSIGLALDQPRTRLSIRRSPALAIEGPESDRVAGHLNLLRNRLGLAQDYRIVIEEAVPAHAGLGSGTQLALAVAAGVRRLDSLPLEIDSDSLLLQRGARSGIGAALFSRGGFVVDGGHGHAKSLPPVVASLPFPEDWRIILVMDGETKGVHGDAEREAFAKLPLFPESEAARICHSVLMGALPALVERDLVTFGRAIADIQMRLGDYFAPAQGGARYTSAKVAAVMDRLERLGAKGVGQSSWGPTGFAFVENEKEAKRLIGLIQENSPQANPTMLICKGINHGARIEAIQAP
ncbi:MAG: beta-ribofuranosylaminobenzene 5'-phosphate synthase family protein [Methylovirgula sp.]|jgi:beta-RFAP synthase